jgi:hypothetical protein
MHDAPNRAAEEKRISAAKAAGATANPVGYGTNPFLANPFAQPAGYGTSSVVSSPTAPQQASSDNRSQALYGTGLGLGVWSSSMSAIVGGGLKVGSMELIVEGGLKSGSVEPIVKGGLSSQGLKLEKGIPTKAMSAVRGLGIAGIGLSVGGHIYDNFKDGGDFGTNVRNTIADSSWDVLVGGIGFLGPAGAFVSIGLIVVNAATGGKLEEFVHDFVGGGIDFIGGFFFGK